MDSNIISITMPKWGLAMKEGSVVKWLKEEGDQVKKGEPIVEIETEKVVNEFESPEEGILVKKCCELDDKIPVGSLMALFSNSKDLSDELINNHINEFNENFKVTSEADSEDSLSTKKIDINGFSINYLHLPNNDNDKNIILIHGFGGDLNNWMFNQEDLAQDFNVYSLDLPGHGLSSKDFNNIDISILSKAITEFCEKNNIEKVNLIGHSFGGGISIKCAIDEPNLVESLTLISPIGLGKEIESSYLEGFISSDNRRELKAELEKLYFHPDIITRDLLNEVLKVKRFDGITEALEMIKNEIIENGSQKTNFIEEINKLELNISIIWGKDDKIIPSHQANDLNKNIKINILDECGHMAHIEKPQEINKFIRDNIN